MKEEENGTFPKLSSDHGFLSAYKTKYSNSHQLVGVAPQRLTTAVDMHYSQNTHQLVGVAPQRLTTAVDMHYSQNTKLGENIATAKS